MQAWTGTLASAVILGLGIQSSLAESGLLCTQDRDCDIKVVVRGCCYFLEVGPPGSSRGWSNQQLPESCSRKTYACGPQGSELPSSAFAKRAVCHQGRCALDSTIRGPEDCPSGFGDRDWCLRTLNQAKEAGTSGPRVCRQDGDCVPDGISAEPSQETQAQVLRAAKQHFQGKFREALRSKSEDWTIESWQGVNHAWVLWRHSCGMDCGYSCRIGVRRANQPGNGWAAVAEEENCAVK